MAKKQNKNNNNANHTSTGNYSLVKTCAFYGLIIAGIAGLLSFVFSLLAKCGVRIDWAGQVTGACNMIAQLALYISAWLAAWDFVKHKNQTFKAFFWVFFVLSLLSIVGLGINTWVK